MPTSSSQSMAYQGYTRRLGHGIGVYPVRAHLPPPSSVLFSIVVELCSLTQKADDNGPSLHGGYLCSVLISGSREYARSTSLVDLNQPDPLSMHVQFLDLAPQGPLHVRFTTLKSSSRSSVVQGEICSAQSTAPRKTYTLAICTMGNLNDKAGISLELPGHVLPSRETDCARLTDAFAFFTSPPTSACRVYTPRGGPTPLWSPTIGQQKRDQWAKLDNGENFRLEELGLLADIVRITHPRVLRSAFP